MPAKRAWLLSCVLSVSAAHVAAVHADDQTDGAATSDEPTTELDRSTDDAPPAAEVIVVEAEAPYVPVASQSVRDRDFALRPHPRPADILRVVPGMFVNQHSGGGKANQYFLRGFDADHGTDIALSFDGVPANMVSHGHGQGYADLNWVIPELVGSIDTFKGPYSPQLGDFATAGSIDLRVRDRVTQSSVGLTGGLFGTYRALGIVESGELLGWRPLAAVELYRSDGPFDNGENNRRYSIYSHGRKQISDTTSVKVAAMSYQSAWNGSGQLPLREVEAGRLDRFGSLDPSEGGESQRHSVYAKLESYPSERSELTALVYAVRYRLNLFSNFTFFSNDPTNGDQIEQEDDRWYGGFSTRYRVEGEFAGAPLVTTVGLRGRVDVVGTSLYDSIERQRTMPNVDADVRQASAGAFAQGDVKWTSWLRTVGGVRLDGFGFQVDDNLGQNSGSEGAVRASPKGSLVFAPARNTDLYVNAGFGFHSNDARALVRDTDRGTPLTRAIGYEVGARSRIADRVDVAGSLWMLDLDQETVWVGDEGVTESRGPTRRLGLELEVRAKLLEWLSADGDVTVSRARFQDMPDDANRIPLAPRFTLTAGLSAQHPSGGFGRFGVRSLSDRPLTEDGFLTAEGFTLFDATLGYRNSRFELAVAIDNMFNASWREAQFATTSRLAGEPSRMAPPPPSACPATTRAQTDDSGNFAGCEDVHFTPGSPFNATVTLRVFF